MSSSDSSASASSASVTGSIRDVQSVPSSPARSNASDSSFSSDSSVDADMGSHIPTSPGARSDLSESFSRLYTDDEVVILGDVVKSSLNMPLPGDVTPPRDARVLSTPLKRALEDDQENAPLPTPWKATPVTKKKQPVTRVGSSSAKKLRYDQPKAKDVEAKDVEAKDVAATDAEKALNEETKVNLARKAELARQMGELPRINFADDHPLKPYEPFINDIAIKILTLIHEAKPIRAKDILSCTWIRNGKEINVLLKASAMKDFARCNPNRGSPTTLEQLYMVHSKSMMTQMDTIWKAVFSDNTLTSSNLQGIVDFSASLISLIVSLIKRGWVRKDIIYVSPQCILEYILDPTNFGHFMRQALASEDFKKGLIHLFRDNNNEKHEVTLQDITPTCIRRMSGVHVHHPSYYIVCPKEDFRRLATNNSKVYDYVKWISPEKFVGKVIRQEGFDTLVNDYIKTAKWMHEI